LKWIEMFGVDIGDDGDIAGSFKKVPSLSSAFHTIHSPALTGVVP